MIQPIIRPIACSFCRKPSSEVAQMITGGGAAICSDCVLQCVTVLRAKAPELFADRDNVPG